MASPWIIRRWLKERLQPRIIALLYFSSIIAVGLVSVIGIALVLLRFLTGSLLAAMGDACSGIFAAEHDFLASSRWNYLLAVVAGAFFVAQLAFLVGGGGKLISVSHRLKKHRRSEGRQCPALSAIINKPWVTRTYLTNSKLIDAQTVGLLRPRILVSKGMVEALAARELEAVLAHEEAHRRGRDNFILAIAKAVVLALFYLPGLKLAFKDMRLSLEMAADNKAAAAAGGSLVVAQTLTRLASQTSRPRGQPAVAAAGSKDLTNRLGGLLLESHPPYPAWRRPALFAAVFLGAVAMFLTSALAVTGSDQRLAFVCFTEHQQSVGPDGVCGQRES